MHGAFKAVDQQGAHQIGVTNLDTTWDPAEIEMGMTFFGRTPGGRRRVFRQWLEGWEPSKQGRLNWFTSQMGEWWIDLRFLKEPTEDFAPNATSVSFNWIARADFPFWSSFPSISTKLVWNGSALVDPTVGSTVAPNFLTLSNRGTQENWPTILLQGPAVFKIGDNGGPRTVTMTLTAGQLARITTLPSIRSVTEVNTGADIFKKMAGRFSTPIGGATRHGPNVVHIPITATGATTGVTSAVASLIPLRRWPE